MFISLWQLSIQPYLNKVLSSLLTFLVYEFKKSFMKLQKIGMIPKAKVITFLRQDRFH